MKKINLFENLYGSVCKVDRRIVMDECNVAEVLRVLNKWEIAQDGVSIGCCGWPTEGKPKWFVNIQVRRGLWNLIKDELKKIGEIYICERIQKFQKFTKI